jgi:hypothetical protein
VFDRAGDANVELIHGLLLSFDVGWADLQIIVPAAATRIV